jgi:hypothetical protein
MVMEPVTLVDLAVTIVDASLTMVMPGAVAVAWTLRNPAVNGAIVGFRRPEQVDPIVAAANLTLDKHDIARSFGGSETAGGVSPLAADALREELPFGGAPLDAMGAGAAKAGAAFASAFSRSLK